MPEIYIDGQAGTTGLEIVSRLSAAQGHPSYPDR